LLKKLPILSGQDMLPVAAASALNQFIPTFWDSLSL